jgi:uncharacterized protein (TIGR02099 family)
VAKSAIATKIGYIAASLIIIFALLVSAGRLLTPYLNEHLPDFEKWSSDLLHAPVKMGHVEIAWNMYEPELAFNDVTILDPNTHKTKFSVQQIKINLNIFRSIMARMPVTESIKIRGAHLTLVQSPKGLPLIEELKGLSVVDNDAEMPSKIGDVLAWIFTQPSLILRDIDISYRLTPRDTKSITINRLILKNNASEHQLLGDGVLNQDLPLHLHTNLKWKGNVADFEHVTADMYVYIEGVVLSQWIADRTWQNLKVEDGMGSAKIWINWRDNQFQKIQSQFQFYDLSVNSSVTGKSIEIPRFSGHVGWKKEGTKEVWAGDDLLIDLPDHLWPNTAFKVVVDSATSQVEKAKIHYLDLQDVQQIGFASGLLSDELQKKISAVNPRGQLEDVTLILPPDSKALLTDMKATKLEMKFVNFGVNAWGTYPGFMNAEGMFSWDGKQGNLTLNNNQCSLDYPAFFLKPLTFEALSSVLTWQLANDGSWTFYIKKLQATNQDANVDVRMSLISSPKDFPTINFSGNFNIKNAATLANYLPLKTLDPDLASWLKQAFLQGQIESGKIILQGKLSDYPFESGTGTLLVSGTLKDIDLQFDSDWPALRQMNGNITFAGSKMKIVANYAKMQNIVLSSLEAEIPYIGPKAPQILNVEGTIYSDLTQGVNFLLATPLKNTLGRDLATLDPKGPMQLDLSLLIPLRRPDNLTLQGNLEMKDALINLSHSHLTLNKVNGLLRFTEKDLQGKELHAQLLGAPASIDVATVQEKNKNSYVKVNLQSVLSVNALQTWLKKPLTNYATGATPYQVEVRIPSKSEDANPTYIAITTNLKGVSLNLPDPYGKKAEDIRSLTANIILSKNSPLQVNFHYKPSLKAALSFKQNNQDMQFYSGELRLGEGEPKIPTQPGLVVIAQFDKLDWAMLQPYLNAATQASGSPSAAGMQLGDGIFREVDVNANQFNLFGQQLDSLRVQISKTATNWLVNVVSSQIVGQVTISNTFKQLQAKLQRFHIVSSGKEGIKGTVNPKSLPALSINANDVQYEDLHLGNVIINTIPTANGMQIKQLDMLLGPTVINASGSWQANGAGSVSRLQGQVATSNITRTLTQWGVPTSSLVGSKATLQFDLNWADAPYNPALKNMNGLLNVNLGHGRVVNLSGSTEAKIGIGRMLSILSLQSIPRRLSLDFSDLFQNGYSFDSMKGTFKLHGGSAYTNDLKFEGPVASLNLAGRIGLLAKDYDLTLGVTTYVTSSLLPAAIGWLGGPIAGVATWLVSTAVSQVSSKVATYQYSISGPWANPAWRQMGSSKVAVPASAARN